MSAAVALRNGVLGLANQDDARLTVLAPALFERYASVLFNLGMRYHAAIAAEEGLRTIANRIPEHPTKAAPDPWRTDGAWTGPGKAVQRLARNSVIYAQNLQEASDGAGTRRLYERILLLVQRISPEDTGRSVAWNLILSLGISGDFDAAIAHAASFAATYPDESTRASAATIDLLMRQVESLAPTAVADAAARTKMEQASRDLAAAADALARTLAAKATLTDAERQALAVARSAPISDLFRRERYPEVIARLGPEFWKQAPSEDVAARMLSHLCASVMKLHEAQPAADAARLLADAAVRKQAYDAIVAQRPLITSERNQRTLANAGRMLARVFQAVAARGEAIAKAGGADAASVAPIVAPAWKAMADLLEPQLDERSDPRVVLFTADRLGDLGERARASRLYECYLRNLGADAACTRLANARAAVLDDLGSTVVQRPELAIVWKQVRAALEPAPDYERALQAMRGLSAKVADMKTVMGADANRAVAECLAAFQRTLESLAQGMRVKARLAGFYRDLGRTEDARALLSELTAYDPEDPRFMAQYVEGVIADWSAPRPVSAQVLEKARTIAITLRDRPQEDPAVAWTARIQVMELSIALNDLDPVNNILRRMRVAGDDLSHDLNLQRTGDDRRIRRAQDAQAQALAERFLRLYDHAGITERPPFRIERVEDLGTSWTLFVDAGAARSVARPGDGTGRRVFAPEGAPP